MPAQYGVYDSSFCKGTSFLLIFAVGLEIIDMEAQYVSIIDGVCNRISVQLFLENIGGRFVRTLFTVYLRIGRIFVENRRTGKTE